MRLKLNQRGIVHHTLLAAIVIVVGVASFGTYKLVASHADSFSSASRASGKSNTAAARNANTDAKPASKESKVDPKPNQAPNKTSAKNDDKTPNKDKQPAKNQDKTPSKAPAKSQDKTPAKAQPKPSPAPAKAPAKPAPTPTKAPASHATAPAPTKTPVKSSASAAPAAAAAPTVSYSAMSQSKCSQLGREYTAGKGCVQACSNGAGTYTLDSQRDGYCSAAFTDTSLVNKQKCNDLHRVWVDGVGCARAYDSNNHANDTTQCQPGYTKYVTGHSGENFATCQKAASSSSTTSKPNNSTPSKSSSVTKHTTKSATSNQTKTDSTPAKPAPKKHKSPVTKAADDVAQAASSTVRALTSILPFGNKDKGVSAEFCASINRKTDGKGGCEKKCANGYGFQGTMNGKYDVCTRVTEGASNPSKPRVQPNRNGVAPVAMTGSANKPPVTQPEKAPAAKHHKNPVVDVTTKFVDTIKAHLPFGNRPKSKGVSAEFCASLNRKTDGKGGCVHQCASGYGFNGSMNGKYDVCTSNPTLHTTGSANKPHVLPSNSATPVAMTGSANKPHATPSDSGNAVRTSCSNAVSWGAASKCPQGSDVCGRINKYLVKPSRTFTFTHAGEMYLATAC